SFPVIAEKWGRGPPPRRAVWYGTGRSNQGGTAPKATIPRPSVIHVAQERAAIPLPDRVTIALAALAETAREGLLALSVGLGLAAVGEIFEEELTQLVRPRRKHSPKRQAYRHGQERRHLTLGGRRVEVPEAAGADHSRC